MIFYDVPLTELTISTDYVILFSHLGYSLANMDQYNPALANLVDQSQVCFNLNGLDVIFKTSF